MTSPVISIGETGTTSTDWTDVSAQFGKNVYQETRMARSGEWLAWFEGGDVGQETATVNQKITIPESEGATLRFWLRKYLDDVSGTLKVSMDEQLLLTVTEESDAYQEWTEVALDVSGFADGNRHTLNFDAAIQVGIGATSFLVDDVSLIAHEGGEGPVDLGDVISALQVAAGMHPAGITADVDINGDQKIGIEEAIHLLRMLGGK